MSPFKTIFLREIRFILSNRALRFVTLIGPFIGFSLILLIFSKGVPRDLPVAIVDQDHTAMSRQITRMMDATAVAKTTAFPNDLTEARKDLESGNTFAVVVIPKDTERNILRGRQSRIPIYINNSNVLSGSLLSSGLRKAISTYSAGIKIQSFLKTGKNSEQALSRALPVMVNPILLFNPYTSYSYYLTATLLPLIMILFVLLGSVYSIGNELYQGTGVEWLKDADGSIITALFAKMLPYTIIFTCIAMVLNMLLFNYLGMPMNGNPGFIIAGEILMIISYQFIAIFLLGLTANMRLSLSLGSAYCMLALTYSGLTFPAIGMPAFAQALARAFPFTYFTQLMVGQSLRGEPAEFALKGLMVFFIFILVGIAFISRLKFLMLNEKYWGKY